jgi:hypothetical protein
MIGLNELQVFAALHSTLLAGDYRSGVLLLVCRSEMPKAEPQKGKLS